MFRKKGIIFFILTVLLFLTFGSSLNTVKAAPKSIALTEELVADSSNDGYDTFYNSWGEDSNFQNTNGKIVTKGIGFAPYYSSTNRMWATFAIQDYNYTTFETTLSFENKWKTGSRGKTTFIIYADDKKIYTKTLRTSAKFKVI